MASPSVLVLGGGPAGSAAACLLAAWGYTVHILTRPSAESRLAESLPPSCHKLFDAIGIASTIERAGFVRSSGNTVWWGAGEPRVESFANLARGWQVDAGRLETVLLEQAALMGARIKRRAVTIEEAERLADEESQAFTLDCTGRAGLLARARGVRIYDDEPRTISLAAVWSRDQPWQVPDDSHTLVESYQTGWAWSVPTAPGRRHVAVMVDPQRSGLARGAAARDVYLAEIGKTRAFREHTARASLDAGPWGWDASPYRATQYAGDGWLLVGDAGAFIDPLSSAGVKKALASAWLAAIVTHTSIAKPAMKTHALEFFSAREVEIESHYARASRRFLAEAAPTHRHAFWADRAELPGTEIETRLPEDSPGVRAAFEQLRQAPALNLQRGGGFRLEHRPAVAGREIVLESRIVTDDRPLGLRFVCNIDAVALVELAPSYTQVPDLFEAYCRTVAPAELPDVLRALATALARRWLVAQ